MKSCSRPSTTRQYRHLRRRNAGAYEEEDRCLLWSPWSRWRVVLMLLYAVIVPAVIIYLLDRFDRLQSPDRVVASRPAWTLRPRAHEQSSLDTKTLWRAKRTLLPHHHHERQQQQTFESVMVKHTAYDSFLLLGDSITQGSFDLEFHGWGAQLAEAYQRRLDIVNRGYSGYTSEQGIHLLPQFLPRVQESASTLSKIQFMTIFFGTNDAATPPSAQHVALDRYEQNIRTLIDMVHSPTSPTYSPETKIILICPGPLEQTLWAHRRQGQGRPMDRDKDVTKQYAAMCLKVGQEYQAKNAQQQSLQHHQVDVIDLWGLITAQAEEKGQPLSKYLRDGVHYTSEANDIVFRSIMEIIKARYPEWDPEKMAVNAPPYLELDLAHPETDLLVCGNKVN